MPDEIKEIPQSGLASFAGRAGRAMQRAGATMAEAAKPLAAKHPIKTLLSDVLLTSPLQAAGAALQDYSGTPREITEDYPYRARLFDPRQPAMVDPRALDLSQFAAPIAGRVRNAARFAVPDLKAAAIAAYGPQASAAHVVKPKGGNWVDNSARTLSDELGSLQWYQDAFPEEAAIDKWISTKLERYIKNEMASPDDPVRAYLEAFPARKQAMLDDKQRQIDKAVADMERARDARGVHPEMLTRSQQRIRELESEKALIEARQGLHYTPRDTGIRNFRIENDRERAGFPRKGLAKGQQAKDWENDADAALLTRPASQFVADNPTRYRISGKSADNPFNVTYTTLQDAESRLASLKGMQKGLGSEDVSEGTYNHLVTHLDDILNAPNPKPFGPLVDNPFVAKLPGQTPLYGLAQSIGRFSDDPLGFSHVADELRNALRPAESGLPEALTLRPKDLDKMTVPQVIEHVDKINAWRAAQKAEANAALANNPATALHKEYATIPGTDLPNEQGLRWVEIKANMPTGLPEGWSTPVAKGNTLETVSPEGHRVLGRDLPEIIKNIYRRHPDTPGNPTKAVQDALTYEGNTMAHCVGGYCEDVTSGSSRIFSLRDAKGQPHVTIEVKPKSMTPAEFYHSDAVPQSLLDRLDQLTQSGQPFDWEDVVRNSPEYNSKKASAQVTQVKAYRDRKPAEQYMPFVQDFIRSNKFPIVGDKHHTDLYPKSDFIDEFTPEQLDLLGDSEYVTMDEIRKFREGKPWTPIDDSADWEPPADLLPPAAGMKKGGTVKRSGPVSQDAMQMQVWDKALRRQTGGASEPTQAEIEAAMRPETVSPRLRALANRAKTQPGVPITDRLVGAGEAATSLASGILGSIPAGYEGMAELLRSRDPARAAQAVETGLQRYTYQPRTATGMQEAQAGAHLLEKLDVPSQYVGNYMLEQTGSPAAATAAQIILDPLNFLPGPKQLASTVRGIPQMLQDAAIQAYGPSATASYVVPPHGNLNLTPQITAETLKGPDRQPIGNFLKQLQGMPGITKEGLEEGLAAAKVLDPTSVVTKAEFEKYITPSKYEKFEIERDPTNSEYYQGLLEHAIDDVHDEFQNMPAFDYLGYEMGIPPRYAEDFNTLVQQTNMPHFADATSLSELEAYGIPHELITLLERNGITTPDAFDRAIDDLTRQAINEQAEVRVAMHIAEEDEPINFSNVQRLVDEDSAAALPFTAYQEIGVRHPNQQGDYRHFPGQRNMIGHFRGTMVPADSRHGVKLADELGTVPPGTFLIEEIQSDVQQSGDMTKHLHQVHGTVAKAAIQHALEQGAHTIYVPTSFPIAEARAGASDNTMQMLRRVYDKEVPSQAIEPLRKIPGVTITTAIPILSPDPKDPKFMFHVLRFTDAAREHILRGPGQKAPGYAKGGRVTNDAMWMAGGGAVRKALKAVLPKGQQAVLSAEESAENLQKFLGNSRIRDTLYHATPKSFSAFKPGGNDPTLSGPAIWLTPNAKSQPAAHNIGGGERGFKEGTNVMPVYAQVRSPLLLDDRLAIEWARDVFAEGSREFPDLISPKTVEELKKSGYDSIIHADPYGNRGGEQEIIMFEPNKIKSAIGNRGTYDITDPDITKAKGGRVTNDAMWMAVQNKQLRKKHGN